MQRSRECEHHCPASQYSYVAICEQHCIAQGPGYDAYRSAVPHGGFQTTDCHLPFLSITAIYHAESYERTNFDLWPACMFIFMLHLNYSKGKGKGQPRTSHEGPEGE